MIEINAWHLVAVVLATVLMTSCVWLGVAVILAGRDKTAERIDMLATMVETQFGYTAAHDCGWLVVRNDAYCGGCGGGLSWPSE